MLVFFGSGIIKDEFKDDRRCPEDEDNRIPEIEIQNWASSEGKGRNVKIEKSLNL